MINDSFVESASNLVFKLTLPTMLFLSLVESETKPSDIASLLGFSLISNSLFFILCYFVIHRLWKGATDNGVLIQGAYRANTGIIAIAYISKLYGQDGVAIAATYVAVTTILYNVLAVIALTPKVAGDWRKTLVSIVNTITKNPLIWGIVAGYCYSLTEVPLPQFLADTGHYLASMTLPVALICAGASLDLLTLKGEPSTPRRAAVFAKLVLAPLFSCLMGYFLGFKEEFLIIIFFMTSAPTAAVSYVMARSMGQNSVLAANIIAMTTLLSVFTITLGLAFLSTIYNVTL